MFCSWRQSRQTGSVEWLFCVASYSTLDAVPTEGLVSSIQYDAVKGVAKNRC